MFEPSCAMLKEISECVQDSQSAILVQRNPTDKRTYNEYGPFDMTPRTVEKAISDYCDGPFDVVIIITPDDISFLRSDMAEKVPPRLWPNGGKSQEIYNTDDEFAAIGMEEDKNDGDFYLPKVLEDQVYFLCDLCTTEGLSVAILFVNAEYIFTQGLDLRIANCAIRLLQTLKPGDHLLCLVVQNADKLYSAFKDSENFHSVKVQDLTVEDYQGILKNLQIYFPKVLANVNHKEVAEILKKKTLSSGNLFRFSERCRKEGKMLNDALNHLPTAKKAKPDTPFELIEVSDTSFADVAGLSKVKDLIIDRVIEPFKDSTDYDKMRAPQGGRLTLFGPPGTGKTLIARAIAGEIDAAFIAIEPSVMKEKYFGDSEKVAAKLFKLARSQRTILFFDEVEGVLAKTDGKDLGKGMRSQILSELDGVKKQGDKILAVAATNYPWLLERALARRFRPFVYVGPPDVESREQILSLELSGIPQEHICYRTFADRLTNYTGADIKEVCDWAKLTVIKEVRKTHEELVLQPEHLDHAISRIPPSITQEVIAEYESYAQECEYILRD